MIRNLIEKKLRQRYADARIILKCFNCRITRSDITFCKLNNEGVRIATTYFAIETQILCVVILFQNHLVSLNVVIVENVVFWNIIPEQIPQYILEFYKSKDSSTFYTFLFYT